MSGEVRCNIEPYARSFLRHQRRYPNLCNSCAPCSRWLCLCGTQPGGLLWQAGDQTREHQLGPPDLQNWARKHANIPSPTYDAPTEHEESARWAPLMDRWARYHVFAHRRPRDCAPNAQVGQGYCVCPARVIGTPAKAVLLRERQGFSGLYGT